MTRMAVGTVRWDTATPSMESLTYCQANRTSEAVRIVRRDTAVPSLTPCQANRTRVAVRTVRRDTAAPDMKSLTSCKPTGPEWL